MKLLSLFLLLNLSMQGCRLCKRQAFTGDSVRKYASADYIRSSGDLDPNQVTLYDMVDMMNKALLEFFDTENNHEPFDVHVNRFVSFVYLIKPFIENKKMLNTALKQNPVEFQMMFEAALSFDEFDALITAQLKNAMKLAQDLKAQVRNKSYFRIAYAFSRFRANLPKGGLGRIIKESGLNLSTYSVLKAIKYRLSIK